MLKKKIIIFILLITTLTSTLIPKSVSATRYTIPETDMIMDIDDTLWHVFHRGNIKDNPKLDELEVTYDYMYNNMQNELIYVDAILYFTDEEGIIEDYIELFVRKKPVDKVKNLNNYSKNEINDLGEALSKEHNINEHEIYRNDYTYVSFEYTDKGFYILSYYTVINGYGYTISAQKPYDFSTEDKNIVKDVIDSIRYEVDETLKEETSGGINWKEVLIDAVIGGATALIISLVIGAFAKKYNNKNKGFQSTKPETSQESNDQKN